MGKNFKPTVPASPRLRTVDRAEQRGSNRHLQDSARFRREMAAATKEFPSFAPKHTASWSIRGTRKRFCPYEPSIMEPKVQLGYDSPDRLKLRQRPWSAATLKPIKATDPPKLLAVPKEKQFRGTRHMDSAVGRFYEPG